MTATETFPTETFRAERFVFAFNDDPPGHAYEGRVSDDAGSAWIDHPYGMVVIAGCLTVERPDGAVETRRRGFASPRTIPTGVWRFTAGPEGCRYVCTHGTVRDGSGPLPPETLIDLTGRQAPYRLVAEDDALLVAIDERPAV